jgi:hypothetical protein
LRLRIGTVAAATALFLAGAVGLLGPWSLATAVVLLVGTSVATAIAWEEGSPLRPPAFPTDEQLVRVPVSAGSDRA